MMRYLIKPLVSTLGAAALIVGCGNSSDDSSGQTASTKPQTGQSGQSVVHKKRDLSAIKQSGVLRVATRNAPTSYVIGRHKNATGPEVDMVRAFAQSIGVKPKFIVKTSIHGVLDTLADGKADIAAAGLTDTPTREKRFRFGPAYQTIHPQVVCSKSGPKAKNIDGLKDVGLTVIGDSSYVERLKTARQTHPDIHWKTDDKVGTETLLRRVWKNKLDCTVADSDIVDVNRRYYPSLAVMFNLGEAQHLAWAMPHDASALHSAVADWQGTFRKSGKLAALHKRYYKYFPKFDYVENQVLVRRIDSRYPKYDQYFDHAATKHDLPPVLLAAQGYQESKWNPHAKSPTGVRGIMMLTGRTAKSLGVDNRLNPKQSIAGGAEYLAKMQSKFNDDIDASDRAYLALAAYNLGYAHIRDAQRLTKQLGKNPDDWSDVRSVLPLLSEKRYYKHLKYGFARGTAPVIYVKRIRNYADIIREHTDNDN